MADATREIRPIQGPLERRRAQIRARVARYRRRLRENHPAKWREVLRKDAARHRIRRGQARVGDHRLLGRVPPMALDDGWWNPDGIRAEPESVTDPHTPIEGTPSNTERVRPDSPAPSSVCRKRRDGVLKRLRGSVRPAAPPRSLEARKTLRERLVLAWAALPKRSAFVWLEASCLRLFKIAGVYDAGGPRSLAPAIETLCRVFQADAPRRLTLMLMDLLACPKIRNVGAVAHHRISKLVAGAFKPRHWPETLTA